MFEELEFKKGGKLPLEACEYMDDGTKIQLKIFEEKQNGNGNGGKAKSKYIFDFNGTGPQVLGNVNAPTAITSAAVMYCLRCLIDLDIPLNSGCMRPIEVRIPKSTLLNPDNSL